MPVGTESRDARSAEVLSIVVPIYNEAEAVGAFYRKLARTVDQLALATEIWFVNDGSTDGTADIVAGIAGEDARVGLINLSRNFGHQMALTAGLDHARGDVVVCMDGDGGIGGREVEAMASQDPSESRFPGTARRLAGKDRRLTPDAGRLHPSRRTRITASSS